MSAGGLKFKAGRAGCLARPLRRLAPLSASLGPSGSGRGKAERSPEGRQSGDGAAQAFVGDGGEVGSARDCLE